MAYGNDEDVASFALGVNVSRMLGVIAERFAKLLHGEIQSSIEIAVGFIRPERLLDFRARHQFVRTRGEERENSKRLWGKVYWQSASSELKALRIKFEEIEPDRRLTIVFCDGHVTSNKLSAVIGPLTGGSERTYWNSFCSSRT